MVNLLIIKQVSLAHLWPGACLETSDWNFSPSPEHSVLSNILALALRADATPDRSHEPAPRQRPERGFDSHLDRYGRDRADDRRMEERRPDGNRTEPPRDRPSPPDHAQAHGRRRETRDHAPPAAARDGSADNTATVAGDNADVAQNTNVEDGQTASDEAQATASDGKAASDADPSTSAGDEGNPALPETLAAAATADTPGDPARTDGATAPAPVVTAETRNTGEADTDPSETASQQDTTAEATALTGSTDTLTDTGHSGETSDTAEDADAAAPTGDAAKTAEDDIIGAVTPDAALAAAGPATAAASSLPGTTAQAGSERSGARGLLSGRGPATPFGPQAADPSAPSGARTGVETGEAAARPANADQPARSENFERLLAGQRTDAATQQPRTAEGAQSPATATTAAPPPPVTAAAANGEGLLLQPFDGAEQAAARGAVQDTAPTIRLIPAASGAGATVTATPVNTLAFHIARHASEGVNRFQIRIDPPEMGRIDVSMEVDRDGGVKVHLTVERSEALDFLQRDARALERALNDAGLDADDGALSFSLSDGDGDMPEDADGDGSRGPGAGEVASDAGETGEPETVAGLAVAGGLDIKV